MSFSLNKNIAFIDSVLFLNRSLDKLVKNLSSENFKCLSGLFSGEELELAEKKGIYPYEYMDSFEKFKERKLPDIECFFSSLKDCGISEEEYSRACKVWKIFEIRNLGMHHDLHLKTDVLLLCDVLEKLINQGLKYYGLDCSHYVSLPSFSWDAMLKFTGVRLEKVDDIDVHLFLEKGMRGGVSYISKRYSKSDKNTQLLYLDFNNLYGCAMRCNYLPYGSFRWLCQKEIDDFKLGSISENSLVGYILEVDLKYCWNFHDLHNDYPLAPEKIEVGYEM